MFGDFLSQSMIQIEGNSWAGTERSHAEIPINIFTHHSKPAVYRYALQGNATASSCIGGLWNVIVCLFLIIYPVIITILAKIKHTHIAHYLGNTAHQKLISC